MSLDLKDVLITIPVCLFWVYMGTRNLLVWIRYKNKRQFLLAMLEFSFALLVWLPAFLPEIDHFVAGLRL